MRSCLNIIAACTLLALAIGCSREEAAPPPKPEPSAEATVDALPPANIEILRGLIKANAGKVVLVDFWATWCEPCLEAFPSLIAWQRKYGDDLVVLSVATDRASNRHVVLDTVAKLKPPFEVRLVDAPDYDAFVRAMSPDWDGGVPTILLYDRAGKLTHTLGGSHSTAEVEAKLTALLKQ